MSQTPLDAPPVKAASILVVDDEDRVRDLCRIILSKAGHRVATAATGEEALPILEKGEIDLLLTDLHLPGRIDGKALAARARERGRAEVIIMTAFPDTHSAVQAVKNGVHDYLIKPFNAETLRMSVQSGLQKKDLMAQIVEERNQKAHLDAAHEESAWNDRIKAIYGQFTSPAVVRMILDHPNDFWKRGEEKDVSLLMVEVAEFSGAVKKLEPAARIDVLNRIFTALAEAAQSEMGHVARIHGEAMMVLFGAPIAMPGHAEAAVRAARRIRSVWSEVAAKHPVPEVAALQLKAAVHSGGILTGCLGTSAGTEFGVIGPRVRAAEDLLRTAKPGQILVSQETVRRTHKEFPFKNHGPLVGAAYQDEVWELELLSSAR